MRNMLGNTSSGIPFGRKIVWATLHKRFKFDKLFALLLLFFFRFFSILFSAAVAQQC